MKNTIYSKCGLIFFALLLSIFMISPVFAAEPWIFNINFEGGTEGEIAWTINGGNGFTGSTGDFTTYSTEVVNSGLMACKMIHYQNTDDWGEAFGTAGLSPTERLHQGDEFWYRQYVYLQSPWIWNSNNPSGAGTKLMRARTQKDLPDGDSVGTGILSVYVRTNVSPGLLRLSNEPGQTHTNTATYLQNDVWQCVEYNVKLDALDRSQGGDPHFRIWYNGELIINDEENSTWAGPDSYLFDFLSWSNWNGGVAQTQVSFVDDIYITNQTPSCVDAQGHPMIGPIGWGDEPPPPVYTGEVDTVSVNPSSLIKGPDANFVLSATFTLTGPEDTNILLVCKVEKLGSGYVNENFKSTTFNAVVGVPVTRSIRLNANVSAGVYRFTVTAKAGDQIISSAFADLTVNNP